MKKRLPENKNPSPENALLAAPGREGASKQAGACKQEQKSMVESVTHHALISDIANIDCLTCGIDTLDVGFYVSWGDTWEERKQKYDVYKQEAQGTDGNLIEEEGIRPYVFYPGGKAPNYRYHARYPEYHCFIAITQSANHIPNVYVSFTSEALHWELSEAELIELVTMDIAALGGKVSQHKISRCDLYADFRILSGLSLEFLKSHMVGKADHTSHYMKSDLLETFYAGTKSSPIQLRLYNKSVKIKTDGSEERWLLLWFTDDPENVWRIEFQIRRAVLNQYRINTISDLNGKKADLWRYMTGDWFSLRIPDHQNQSRRTLHPFWKKVQETVHSFGPEKGAKRNYVKKNAVFIRWHIKRIISLMISCAGITKDYHLADCLKKVSDQILQSINEEDFRERARKKSVELGTEVPKEKEAVSDADDIYRKIVLRR